MDTPTPPTNPPVDGAKLPPFVNVVMTPEGMAVQTNLTDKLMALALLEGAKFSLMQEKPVLHKPDGFINGLRSRLRG